MQIPMTHVSKNTKKIDTSILRGLINSAKQAKWTSSDLGVDGFKAKIDLGIDITDDEWTKIQDQLNERRQSLGLDPIQINFETGNIETVFDETKAQYQKFMDDLSSGVGAISTLGNAFDDLKNIGEDLADAFSGEMDAWDALMTVFNSGIGIMETVIGVMEAINTLNELSIALSGKKKAEQALETAEVVGGKGAEASATLAETEVSANELAVDTADAAAKAGKSVAWIPIVGPILAAAAIAAILGAILGAKSKGKSAGKFAQGGMVEGNSYSGDNIVAMLNAGEGVLTAKGVENAAAMANNVGLGNLQLSMEVNADKFLIGLNNSNRMRGGSRGYYTNIH